MPYLVTFEDLQSNLVEEDFDPSLGVKIERYATKANYKDPNQKEYHSIKDPERFTIAVARQQSVNKPFMDYFPNLKFIHIIGHGYESVDAEEVKKRGIILCNCGGLYSGHMAEDCIMRMIFLSRRSLVLLENQRNKVWKLERPLPKFEGSTVCILGSGSIGRALAEKCQALGAHVVGVASKAREIPHFDKVYGAEDRKEAVKGADYVVNLLRDDPTTDNYVNAELIDCMKDGVIYVNVGRGSTQDDDALIAALKSGKIAAGSSDVFKKEPLPADSEYWTLPNFWVTPHNSGGHHIGAGEDRRKWIAYNVSEFIKGTGNYTSRVF